MFDHVPLWLCEDITACCYMYCYFRNIASARIHVERSIQHLKTFDILTYIPYQYKKHANKILKVCVCLTNLQKPILREIA